MKSRSHFGGKQLPKRLPHFRWLSRLMSPLVLHIQQHFPRYPIEHPSPQLWTRVLRLSPRWWRQQLVYPLKVHPLPRGRNAVIQAQGNSPPFHQVYPP